MCNDINYNARRSTPSLRFDKTHRHELVEWSRGSESWYVYIAIAGTKRYYTGITTDTDKRIEKHNNGKGSRFAIQQGGLTLMYKSKPFVGKSEARKREAQIKKWSRKKKEKLISGEWE